MLYESCRRFTEESSTANENCLEFSFDFGMSDSEKKGVENGVDAHTQSRKNKEKKKEPLSFNEWELLPGINICLIQDNIKHQFVSKGTQY